VPPYLQLAVTRAMIRNEDEASWVTQHDSSEMHEGPGVTDERCIMGHGSLIT